MDYNTNNKLNNTLINNNLKYNNENIQCKDYALLYLKCMKINNPSHTKCKREFELWYQCFNLINIKY